MSDQLKKSLESAKSSLKSPFPTPPVGTNVVWYNRAMVSPENQRAAVVTAVEGAGRLSLTIFGPMEHATHKKGVLFKEDPTHGNRNNMMSQTNGAWGYPDGVRVCKSHYEAHVAEIQRRIARIESDIEVSEAVKEKSVAAGTEG